MLRIDTGPSPIEPDGTLVAQWIDADAPEMESQLWELADGRYHVVLRDNDADGAIVGGTVYPAALWQAAIECARRYVNR